MLSKALKWLLTVMMVAMLAACGGSGGGESDGDTGDGGGTIPDTTPQATGVELTTSLEQGVVLSQGGQTTFTAYVTQTPEGGTSSQPVSDGTKVNFEIAEGGGQITSFATTQDGYATATYKAGTFGGTATVRATVADSELTDTLSIQVATGTPSSIVVDSVTPGTIGVIGSGKPDVANITFAVNDAAGNPVPDGNTVNFSIITPLGGGEELSPAEDSTVDGQVTVALQSGTVSGTVAVNAVYTREDGTPISTEARVTIVSGRPEAKHLSLAAEYLNIAGGTEFGLQDTISAYLGDRYGNVVPDGTSVSFMTEGGTIGESTGFTTSTSLGVAQAVLQTSNPTTPELDGGDPTANPGLCRVVVYTPGSEAFYDANGNGVFDEGVDELTKDMSDPYIDANDNGQHDPGETYIDADENGAFSPADGEYQKETMIWTSMNIIFSAYLAPINLSPQSFSIPVGGSQSFTFTLEDEYGNPPVAGTTVTVEPCDGATVEGFPESGYVQADTASTNWSGTMSFSIRGEADPAEGDLNKPCDVTVTVTPPDEGEQGNNGAVRYDISTGTINVSN